MVVVAVGVVVVEEVGALGVWVVLVKVAVVGAVVGAEVEVAEGQRADARDDAFEGWSFA